MGIDGETKWLETYRELISGRVLINTFTTCREGPNTITNLPRVVECRDLIIFLNILPRIHDDFLIRREFFRSDLNVIIGGAFEFLTEIRIGDCEMFLQSDCTVVFIQIYERILRIFIFWYFINTVIRA